MYIYTSAVYLRSVTAAAIYFSFLFFAAAYTVVVILFYTFIYKSIDILYRNSDLLYVHIGLVKHTYTSFSSNKLPKINLFKTKNQKTKKPINRWNFIQ